MTRAEILTVAQNYAADRFAAQNGVATLTLMENAGTVIAEEIVRHYPRGTVAILCGPGNNGGDGFVIARLLQARGWPVRLALAGEMQSLKGDAAVNARRWAGAVEPIGRDVITGCSLIVDALFGAGLTRPLQGVVAQTVTAMKTAHPHIPVIAVDIPSGLAGDSGQSLGDVFVCADRTITFFRKKPVHVLMPGRLHCGTITVADIGIPPEAIHAIQPAISENTPDLWGRDFPRPHPLAHKYARGHALTVSGPAHATGAARLAARAALRIGAGLVSVASPTDAVAINAAHLTAIMVKPFDGPSGLTHILADKRYNAALIGPGAGVNAATRALAAVTLRSGAAVVLDADALTTFAADPGALFDLMPPNAVLTPHGGEFARLFPDLHQALISGKNDRISVVRQAAARAQTVVLLKGPDTTIAAPDGRVAICINAPPTLATAGSGDVLAGLITGLLAQGMDPFAATCAGAWLHGEAATAFGPGLIAEDLPEMLPAVLHRLYDHLSGG